MALVGNGGIDMLPGIFCQCTNDACGALLRMANDYKHGQVVGCPECGSPFTIAPESPTPYLDELNSTRRSMSPLAMLRTGGTPESARLLNIKKDTLFQFPSPGTFGELGSMLDIPDADMLVSSFGHCQQMRNLTPSLEATVAFNGGNLHHTSIFPEDIHDLARIGGLGTSPLRPSKAERKASRARDRANSGGHVDQPDPSVEAYLAANTPIDEAMQAHDDNETPEPSEAPSGGGGGACLACKFCGKVFKKAGRLLTHERKHTGERPYSCTECTKSFRDGAALEGHISRQHREQPFHCVTCEKGFSSKRQLMIHGRVHTGEKPFSCSVCKRTFSQEGNLHTHIRRHMVNFGLDPIMDDMGNEVENKKQCRLCGFHVDDDASLKTHVKYHIKAGDLIKLTDFMTGSSWSYDGEYEDGRRLSTTTSMDDEENGMSLDGSMDHRDSIDSLASGSASLSPRSM